MNNTLDQLKRGRLYYTLSLDCLESTIASLLNNSNNNNSSSIDPLLVILDGQNVFDAGGMADNMSSSCQIKKPRSILQLKCMLQEMLSNSESSDHSRTIHYTHEQLTQKEHTTVYPVKRLLVIYSMFMLLASVMADGFDAYEGLRAIWMEIIEMSRRLVQQRVFDSVLFYFPASNRSNSSDGCHPVKTKALYFDKLIRIANLSELA